MKLCLADAHRKIQNGLLAGSARILPASSFESESAQDSRLPSRRCRQDACAPGGRSLAVLTLFVVVLAGGSGLTTAQVPNTPPSKVQQGSAGEKPAPATTAATIPAPADQSPAQKYFTDVVLINQDGEKMRLYSDLLQGKVVIINSFFATCQGSCLPMSRNLEKVQQALGDRLGKDVRIISISVDPTVDTPPALKAYAKKLGARPGWYFLTGDKQNVEFALSKLGQFVSDKETHLNTFIIGNERTGLWKKAFGLAQSDALVEVVKSVLDDQPAGGK